ncbi:class II aldolase/adducin family protein [Streptomyces violaceusniger]|uniref:class II aldolase/adducin family protein n=1 Tax=Streptomyces violaceusniger TaxID=68280 RepID=UPI0031D22F8D
MLGHRSRSKEVRPDECRCRHRERQQCTRDRRTGALIATRDLGRALAEGLGDANAILMPHHGAVTVGPDIGTAVMYAVLLERACRTQLLAGRPDRPPVTRGCGRNSCDDRLHARHQAFAVVAGGFARQALGTAIGVGVGGVDEVVAVLDVEVERVACLVPLRLGIPEGSVEPAIAGAHAPRLSGGGSAPEHHAVVEVVVTTGAARLVELGGARAGGCG